MDRTNIIARLDPYDVLVALRLEPRADAELVLKSVTMSEGTWDAVYLVFDGAEEAGLLLGGFTALVENGQNLCTCMRRGSTGARKLN